MVRTRSCLPGDDSADDVSVPAEILGAGIHDKINSILHRAAVDGSGESAVNQRDEAVLFGDGPTLS